MPLSDARMHCSTYVCSCPVMYVHVPSNTSTASFHDVFLHNGTPNRVFKNL